MIALALLIASQTTPIQLTDGLQISASTTVATGEYLIPNAFESEEQGGAITINGDNIIVDFKNATLRGTPQTSEPNERAGVGIVVKGRSVTIRNLNAHGYKVGLFAKGAHGLRLENCNFDYNWKQKLGSTLEKEDVADWMSYHQNEEDEWLRFGGAIYLRDCDRVTIKGVVARGGQNGLMMTECDSGLIYNCDFSYLSSLGLGMYRSSGNRIMHNNIDYCVRGYSHGVYNRGQDSAGILIYEQSHKNTFAYNSVTHGGDGFFLWAGQTTMDTGKGGCNDNLLFGNDFSHAPTNGIEATFSRNKFVNNLMLECWHGVWGGYSYESEFLGNTFGFNAEAIAIEHGQDNSIVGNLFVRDRMGINIWQNASQDPNWGYPKNRDTRSRDYLIAQNVFRDIETNPLVQRSTIDVTYKDSVIYRGGPLLREDGSNSYKASNLFLHSATKPVLPPVFGSAVTWTKNDEANPAPTMQGSGNLIMDFNFDLASYIRRFNVGWDPWARAWAAPAGLNEAVPDVTELERRVMAPAPAPLIGGKNPFLKSGTFRGRRSILVDEWGPYDFKRPILWPRMPLRVVDGFQEQRFDLYGPAGRWTLKSVEGVTVSKSSGNFPDSVIVRWPVGTPPATTNIQMEYVGVATTDYRGVVTPAGARVPFGYSKTFIPIAWTTKFFKWEKDISDPRTQKDAFDKILAGAPLATVQSNRLEGAWYGSPAPGVPDNYFATVNEGKFNVAKGKYKLSVTTDDGCRVWVDGKVVIDNAWKYQGPTQYSAELELGGEHHIKIEHFEIDGFSTLMVKLEPEK